MTHPDTGSRASIIGPFDLQAHRGGRNARPENTLAAFAYAMAIGVTTLEMDMHITQDGHLVISHDACLPWYLTRDSTGKPLLPDQQPDIRQSTLATLKTFDVGVMNPANARYFAQHGVTQKPVPGSRIPTLDEVFDLITQWGQTQVRLNVETKFVDHDPLNPDPQQFVALFYDRVTQHGFTDRVMLQSFDWRTLSLMKQLDPSIPTAALTSAPDSKSQRHALEQAHRIAANVFSSDHQGLSSQLIEQAHALDMKVIPWTVNKPKDMQRLIDWGVDGLITDSPAVLRDLLHKHGRQLPDGVQNPDRLPHYTGTD
jgi:glycerophosphoryl diester phosphodiesterase